MVRDGKKSQKLKFAKSPRNFWACCPASSGTRLWILLELFGFKSAYGPAVIFSYKQVVGSVFEEYD